MSSQHPYSSLESFFVFNTIKLSNTRPIPFDEISKALKENDALVKNRSSTYLARFGPEAIKELCLALIKEEARSRVYGQGGEVEVNGDGQKDGTKQKARGGETEEEELMNIVHTKCYIRYRDEAIALLRADEKAYLELKQRADQEEKDQLEAAKVKSPKVVPLINNLLRHDGEGEAVSQSAADGKGIKSPTSHVAELAKHSESRPPSLQSTEATLVEIEGPRIPATGPLEPRQSLVEGRQIPNPYGQNPYGQQPFPQPQPPPKDPQPFLPPFQPASHNFSDIPPPLPDVHRRPSYPPPQASPSISSRSPGLSQGPLPPVERPSSGSPIILPPPPGMVRASSAGGPLETLVDSSTQQYRPTPAIPSSRLSQSPSQLHSTRQLPQPRSYGQQQYPYHDAQAQQSPAYPPYNQNPPRAHPPTPHQPPPSNAPIYGTPSQHSQTVPPYTYPQYSQSSSYYPHAPAHPSYGQAPTSIRSGRHAPSTPASGRSDLPKLSPIDTGGSATRWKRTLESFHERPRTPTSPGPGAISPVLAPSPSSVMIRAEKELSSRGRGGPPRRGRSTSHLDRGASTISAGNSTAYAPMRSASAASRHEDSRSVKNEAPATPAAEDVATDSSATFRPTRNRRGTIRTLNSDAPGSNIRSAGNSFLKRKRGAENQDTPTASPTTPSFLSQPPAPPTFTRPSRVTGMRNFPRTSQTIMNDITSHKHAYMFQQPLSNRQAPGYKDVIYRPQDLKSIKSAVTSGARALITAANAIADRAETPASARTVIGDQDAIAAASPAPAANTPAAARNRGTPSFTSSASANVVTVPVNPDIIPPKGIVNSGQFEKEVMRTFANAIMFNPDPKRGFPKLVVRRIRKGNGAGVKEKHVPKGMELKREKKQNKGKGTEGKEEDDENQEETSDEEASGSANENDDDHNSEGWLGNERDRDVVHDTREMFEAIEQKIAQWREAERAAENRVKLRGGDSRSDDEGEDDGAGAAGAQADEESKIEAASSEVEKSGVESRGRAAKRRRR